MLKQNGTSDTWTDQRHSFRKTSTFCAYRFLPSFGIGLEFFTLLLLLTLGDFFDRTDLNAQEITALQDVYFCDKPHIFLTGNHEANSSSLEYSTAQVFQSIDAEVITDIKRVEINDKD